MQVDDPPYLSVGTAVSAKYKGAFCEAKVSKVVRIVKCKVTYKMGLGTAIVNDDQIKGTLRVGQVVQAKHPDKKELVEATIAKIQDCSQYTVVFDDGDITTLRRTALCLKSGRHFNESETLDQLPLTHPEHFGNPVVGGRRGRRSRQPKEDSSDGEVEEENEPDFEGYSLDIGRIVSVEATDKKRNKDNWFPGLVVIPSAQPTVRINMKDEYLIRSFKDGRYYTVPKKEVSEFSRELGDKVESPSLSEAIQKALRFLDLNELPPHWEKNTLLYRSQAVESESDENFTDTSDDEPCEEKDRFVAQLYKFMDDAGTPLNKTPMIAGRDIDLHRLFRVVHKLGGGNRVTNQNKWRTVTAKLHLPNNQNTFNQVKAVYKRCLASYETFYRTLGVTMLNHTRSNKKNRGRSLIRDKDRSTPIHSPAAVEKEEDPLEERKEEPKGKAKDKKKLNQSVVVEVSDTGSSDAVDPLEIKESTSRTRRERTESKSSKDRKLKGEKVKALVEKFEEQTKKEEAEKVQFTRSKSQSQAKAKEPPPVPPEKKPEPKVQPKPAAKPPPPPPPKKPVVVPPPPEEDKRKGKKRTVEEKVPEVKAEPAIHIGDKLKVYYGPTNESKVTYEAKVIEIDKDQTGSVFLVHYTGWNTRYDEWIQPQRIAENLTSTTKAKRQKQAASSSNSKASTSKNAPPMAKRKRGSSVTSRGVPSTSATPEAPRSTTPSSVTSSSSRTKSPAVTQTRSQGRITRQDASKRTRRVSAQTDVSIPTESDSDGSGSESDLSRTRSGAKAEEPELKTYRRRPSKPPITPKSEKRKEKEDDDTEKEEEPEKIQKRSRRLKKSPEKSTEESEDEVNPPKGRDFDLNQIRSELKGFTKAINIKIPPINTLDKDVLSSSDDSTNPPPPPLEKPVSVEEEEPEDEDEKEEEEEEKIVPEKSPQSSEDIYEFKEPEPFEFESRAKLTDDKTTKKRLVARLFDDIEKSPKKKSPKRSPKQESPDRRSFRRTPLRRQDSSDEDEPVRERAVTPPKELDPFDKLVESPSFNLIKTVDKPAEKKQNVVRNISDDTMSLFRELPETEDDCSKDMELSDCESQTQIFTREPELFSDTFSKPSPDQNTMDMEFSSGKTDEGKLKDSDDDLREQIQRAIAQGSSTDDDSNDALLITPTPNSYQGKKRELDLMPSISSILGITPPSQIVEVIKDVVPPAEPEIVKEESEKASTTNEKQTISPALQETDSSLLESIVSHPPVSLDVKLEETAKELANVKTGTKVADSILQKLNSIKKTETKSDTEQSPVKPEVVEEAAIKTEEGTKLEFKFELPKEEIKHITAESELPEEEVKPEEVKQKDKEEQEDEEEVKIEEEPVKKPPMVQKSETTDSKKRRKVLSRAFIEETDSDSSDSEQLVIARSDDDSQTNSLDTKLQRDHKESDSSNLFAHVQTTDDSQSQEERNFNFDIKEDEKEDTEEPPAVPDKEDEPGEKIEAEKEEETDPQLHSLLLCEEEIPRSPAPPSESVAIPEIKPKSEMPFASAPGTSCNNKSMLLEQPQPKKMISSPVQMERENRVEASTVLDNTPPTTPESTISNLSPRGENGDMSPNAGDESCKSNDVENDYPRQRRNSSVKVSPYSEEDTQMNSEPNKKSGQENISPPFKKRRKSLRSSDDSVPLTKRSKKGQNRSRQNSDSDDTSEHSNGGSSTKLSYNRGDRSPRPSKYNFFVEFDPSLDSGQRIAVLQQKLSELRKTYADVKAELAAVERRRKKIRRREREALKAAKQEMACA